MVKNVKVIPASKKLASQTATQESRVAGYARVSTLSDEQLDSYEAQLDYYTNYIKNRAGWQFVRLYADEGISGLSTKKRDDFNQMIEDALSGKVDIIVTKSISRFARNTVDSLTAIRKLKAKGVAVIFEKENINTMDSTGDLLLTIMAAIAQEESRSISENVRWGKQKRMQDGQICLPWKSFLGYKKGADGLPEIVPEEAEIVKTVYRRFLEGENYSQIARYLTAQGIPTPRGLKKWETATVRNILTNETYKGCKVLQKMLTVDFLTRKRKVNEGELPQYVLENSHPAIIPPDEWEKVQERIKNRKRAGNTKSKHPFVGKIKCGGCGGWFGKKVLHSNSKYRRTVWRCNAKYKSDTTCKTPHVVEAEVKDSFVLAIGKDNREVLISDYKKEYARLGNLSDIESERAKLEKTAQKAWAAIQSGDVSALQTHNAAQERQRELEGETDKRAERRREVAAIIELLVNMKVAQFNERVWDSLVSHAEVTVDGVITIHFK